MPHTTPKTSRIPGPLHKAGLFVLFAAITAALCLLLNFLLVDDLHAYSRVTLGEYYAQADAVDTVFVGSSHSYRSFDPDTIDPILGSHSFNLGTSQQQPDGSYWLIREAAANSPLKTVYLETFYTGYNQPKIQQCSAGLLPDHRLHARVLALPLPVSVGDGRCRGVCGSGVPGCAHAYC